MISRDFINRVTIAYVLVMLIVGIASYLFVAPVKPEQLPAVDATAIKEPAEKALALSLEMIKLVTTLSTGLIAVGIWLLKRPFSDAQELVERLIWSSAAIVALSASLYFGFAALDAATVMLSFKVFDPRANLFWRPQTCQYYAFVTGALLLGLACIRSINAMRDSK